MGSVCCVAARDRSLPNRISSEGSHRSGRFSSSWSYRWDNHGPVGHEIENLSDQFSIGIGRNVDFEIKGGMDVESEDVSDRESPLENFRVPAWRKSLIHGGAVGTPASDQSMGSNFSTEMKDLAESSAVADPSASKLSFSIPSTSSLSTFKADSLSYQSHPLAADSTPSRQARRSPGHQLLRQVSDSRIPGLNSSVSEGRPSFVFSMCSNDLMGSQGGSSDGWSMRTFSELVASSQRDRWSFDSETLGSSRGKVTRSSSRLSACPSIDLRTCGVCSKLLTERSSWSSNELSVVAVLFCGHVYHSECLENMTPEVDKYDPSCPICTAGEKKALKMFQKASKAAADVKVRNSKISRNRVVDSSLDGNSVLSNSRKSSRREGKGPKIGPSSSMKSSFGGPFLRRHFSLGRKSTKSLSENDSARRKGFWTRHQKN